MQNESLQQAITLIRSGQREPAKAILESLLKSDPRNVQAWFWYAETCSTVAQRLQVLETCQRFNPGNPQVQDALESLRAQQSKAVASAPVEKRAPAWEAAAEESQLRQSPAKPEPQPDVPKRTRSRPFAWVMWLLAGLLAILCVSGGVYAVNTMPANAADHRFTSPYEYYLYVPRAYTSDHAWPVFIGVHGSGGSGLDCWNWWQPYAEKEGFILICPSIADSGGGWYQDAGETKLFAVINQVGAQYRLESRYFLAGFSAGGQFVQGYAFHYPQSVKGVAVLSPGNYYLPTTSAWGIPFLVVIGERDIARRLEATREFVSILEQNNFNVEYHLLPGVGTAVPPFPGPLRAGNGSRRASQSLACRADTGLPSRMELALAGLGGLIFSGCRGYSGHSAWFRPVSRLLPEHSRIGVRSCAQLPGKFLRRAVHRAGRVHEPVPRVCYHWVVCCQSALVRCGNPGHAQEHPA